MRCAISDRSDQLHHPSPRLSIRLNVPLGRGQCGMTSQQLNVAEATAHGRYASSGIGNECAATAVTGATSEAQCPVPGSEQVHDRSC